MFRSDEYDVCEMCRARDATGSFPFGGVETRMCGGCSDTWRVDALPGFECDPTVVVGDMGGNWTG